MANNNKPSKSTAGSGSAVAPSMLRILVAQTITYENGESEYKSRERAAYMMFYILFYHIITSSHHIIISSNLPNLVFGPSPSASHSHSPSPSAKTVIFSIFIYRHLIRLFIHLKIYGLTKTLYQLYRKLSIKAIHLFLSIPTTRRKVEKELDKAMKEVEEKLVLRPKELQVNEKLPTIGWDSEKVL